MSVYVDEIRTYTPEAIRDARARRLSRRWSHLSADTVEELHAFAARLGMRREWFQEHRLVPHYDLIPSRRALALKLGAEEITARRRLQIAFADAMGARESNPFIEMLKLRRTRTRTLRYRSVFDSVPQTQHGPEGQGDMQAMSTTITEPREETKRRTCRGKRRFDTRAKAQGLARSKREEFGVPYHAKECEFCGGFHVERKA